MQGGGRSDLPDGLRQAGTTNDGRDEDSKTMRITTHCHGLYPRLQVHARPSKTTILNTSPSPCGSTIGGDSSNITTRPILKEVFSLGIAGCTGGSPLSDAACTRKKMRDTDRRRRNERNMQNKTNRSIRTDKYRYRHFERTPRTTPPSPRRGGDSAVRKTGRLQYGSQ